MKLFYEWVRCSRVQNECHRKKSWRDLVLSLPSMKITVTEPLINEKVVYLKEVDRSGCGLKVQP